MTCLTFESSDEKKSLADKINVLYDISLHDMKYFIKMVYKEHVLSYDLFFACYVLFTSAESFTNFRARSHFREKTLNTKQSIIFICIALLLPLALKITVFSK